MMATSPVPATIALAWSRSPPLGSCAKFATMPFTQVSVFSAPSKAIIEAIHDWLYKLVDERTNTLPFHFSLAKSS